MRMTAKQQKRAKDAFIEALLAGGKTLDAAEASGVHHATLYRWKHDDPEFAAAWESAWEAGADALEDEGWRRAKEGVDEPVFQGGQLVGTVRKYSDTLLIFLMKGRRPDRYARFETRVTGPGGGPIKTEHRVRLTLEDVARFAEEHDLG